MNVTESLTVRAEKTPEAPAVVAPQGALSYGELDRAVSWTARAFGRAGLAPGDLVAIDLSGEIRHLIASLAIARLGAGQLAFDTPDPPFLRQEFVRRFGIVATVTDRTDAQTPTVDPPSGDLADFRAKTPIKFAPARDGGLPFLLMRTSGTATGVPRAGLTSHATARPRIAAKGFLLPEGPGTRYLSLGRLSFNSVKFRAFHCLLSGGCLMLHDGWDDLRPLAAFVAEHRINYLSCAPVRAARLLAIAREDAILLPGVAAFRVGSAFVPDALREAIRRRLTPNLYIAYGMTEIGTVSVAPPALVRKVPGVVGMLTPGVEAEVVDGEGKPLTAGSAGLLRLKSPGMIDGYVDAPAETARAFRDGWFYSDDFAEFTRNGELIHHGRADDVMIFDGVNINPAEIENALLRHPAIAEAAAFSVPSPARGDCPFAAVVIRSPVSEDELLSHCRSRLGAHAPLGIAIVPELPRNAAGKILKNDLRTLVRGA